MYLKNKSYVWIPMALNTTLYAKGSFEAILSNKPVYGFCAVFKVTLFINTLLERAL